MSEDAPSAWVNISGNFMNTDQWNAVTAFIGWVAEKNARYLYEKIIRGDGAVPRSTSGRQVFPHAHGVQVAAPECGLVLRRSVINEIYTTGAVNNEAIVKTITVADGWQEVARQRGSVGGFVDLASEVRFQSTQPLAVGEALAFKIESCDANDSAACDASDHDLAEAASDATAHVGAMQWHTINESAGTGKELTIDAGTSTDPGDTISQREFILYARAYNGDCQLNLTNWRVWEIVTGDL